MSIVLTSTTLGIVGAIVGTGLGSAVSCFIGGLPMGNSPKSACVVIGIGACAGAEIFGTVGFIAPSIWAIVTAVAQSVFWSFSYLTAGVMSTIGTLAVTINPLILTISAFALVGLGLYACRSLL